MAKKKIKKLDEGGYLSPYARIDDAKSKNWSAKDGATDAIEPVYPLEELALAGPAGKIIGRAAGALDSKAAMLRRPAINNRLYNEKIGGSEYAAGDTTKKYGARNVFSPSEIEDIKASGFMRPKQTPGPRGKAPKQDKYFTMTDEPNQTLRVASDKIPKGRAVRREDIEMFDKESGTYKPLKKGGSVRGHGCESKGKTKGRFV
jgi:hypothetical protein